MNSDVAEHPPDNLSPDEARSENEKASSQTSASAQSLSTPLGPDESGSVERDPASPFLAEWFKRPDTHVVAVCVNTRDKGMRQRMAKVDGYCCDK